jgi:threonine 3-dehydrogenase
VVPEVCLRKIPDSIPEEVAAILEPLGIGVHPAQVGDVQGKKVAVLGAGPIGLYSACASLALGAESVYISDLKQMRLDVAPSITHRFSLEDFEEAFRVALNGEGVKVLLRP